MADGSILDVEQFHRGYVTLQALLLPILIITYSFVKIALLSTASSYTKIKVTVKIT